ncbi:VOC family protein [Pararhodobacter sp.]|uniref:VOC family protein n=1 Tax=Pararhodobacter sp. TaxID=2127056 RepID=UPI002FDF20BA
MPAPLLPAVDHVVLLVHDLVEATSVLEGAGFTVLRRADQAEKPGSTFRFVSFADGSYILLNAFSAEAMARHRLGPVLAEREGWGDWSLCVDDLDAAIARADGAGIALGGENAVRNVLTTGEAWGLRLLVSGRGSPGDPALPFLVQDTEGRGARIPGPSVHANGASGIAGVSAAAEDPLASARRTAALAGLPAPDRPRVVLNGATLDFIPLDPGARGTARLGGPVSIHLRGLAAPLPLPGGWDCHPAV